MKTITKQFKIYSFDELSKKAQQRAIEDHREINVDYEWYDFIFDDFIKEAAEKGLTVNYEDISFSGFWSQGDGASFTGTVETSGDIEKLLNALNITFKHKALKCLFIRNANIYIKRLTSHYYHKNTITCIVNFDGYSYYSIVRDCIYKRLDDYLYKKAGEIEKKLEALKDDLCNKLYKELESEYDYQTSDDAIKETFIINEYEFLENGTIY